MQWLTWIAGACCLAVVALFAFWYAFVGVMLLVERRLQRRRRAQFREHEAFRTDSEGNVQIVAEGLKARLEAIGPFTLSPMAGALTIHWQQPAGLAGGPAPTSLSFVLQPDNVGPDDETFRLWEQYRQDHARHARDFETRLIEICRTLASGCSEAEKEELVRQISICIWQSGYGDAAAHRLEATFDFPLDEEHAYRLPVDPRTGTFGEWEN
jgi:hypothetical protein